MNIYKKCSASLYSFLIIDVSLISNNLLRESFRKNININQEE